MSDHGAQNNEVQRWTAKRKAAVVLEVLRNQNTAVEACRKYGIKQSDLERWPPSSSCPVARTACAQ